MKMVICDDSSTMRNTLMDILFKLGHEHIDSFSCGQELLKGCSSSDESVAYDVIFLDMSLPDVNGMTVLQTLHNRFPKTSIILFCGCELDTVVRGLKLGASDVLQKPPTVKRVQTLLKRLTQKCV